MSKMNKVDLPSNNIHGQNNSTKNGQFTEHISGLFLSLVHPDVDLSEVVAVGSRKDPIFY